MGDGGKGDFISPDGPPVSVSDIPDLIPTNLTDYGNSGGSVTSTELSSSTEIGDGGHGVGIDAGRGTLIGEDADDVEDDDGGTDGPSDFRHSESPDGELEPDEADRDDDEEQDEQNPEEDENEDEHQVMMVIQLDPWDNIAWGLEPLRLRIKEEYGDQVGIYDDLVPVRKFKSPSTMKEIWERDSKRHKMPVNTSVWDDDPPESTELANRAYTAARHQGLAIAADYLRRLRVAAIVEGTNIENEETLFELAEEVGLDVPQLKEDWAGVESKTSTSNPETPKTFVHADDETIEYEGYIHIDDLKMIFEQAGLDEHEPQPLRGFLQEHGPVTANEVMFVYGYESIEAARSELQQIAGVKSVKYGSITFWAIAP